MDCNYEKSLNILLKLLLNVYFVGNKDESNQMALCPGRCCERLSQVRRNFCGKLPSMRENFCGKLSRMREIICGKLPSMKGNFCVNLPWMKSNEKQLVQIDHILQMTQGL